MELRREHDVAVLAALALLDPDHHPLAVDVGNLQQNDFRHAQAGGIDGGQRGTALEARDHLQKAHHLVGAEHNRQLARLTRIGDALRHDGLAERHAIEEPQRADDLASGYRHVSNVPNRGQLPLRETTISFAGAEGDWNKNGSLDRVTGWLHAASSKS